MARGRAGRDQGDPPGRGRAAAAALGAEIGFFDAGDYPLVATPELIDELVSLYREVQPAVVLTHPLQDPYNGDHPAAHPMALEARVLAQARRARLRAPVIGAPPVFFFEPHQPEQCGFRPNVLLDITEVWEPSARRWSAWPRSSTCDLLHRPRPPPRHAGRNAGPNLGLPHDHGRGVHAPLPAGHGGRWHEQRDRHRPRRRRSRDVDALGRVRRGHGPRGEAPGPLEPAIRPIQAGPGSPASAVTVLCRPGDNLMIHAAVEQCGTATSWSSPPPRPPPTACSASCSPPRCGPRRARPGHRRRRPRRRRTAGDGLPRLGRAVSAQGTVKATRARSTSPWSAAASRPPGDVVVADDDGVVVVPRDAGRRPARGGRAREAKERANGPCYRPVSSAWTATGCGRRCAGARRDLCGSVAP